MTLTLDRTGSDGARTRWRRFLLGPALSAAFLVMWTSGFIAGPIGVRSMAPLALTFWRFALAAVVLAVISIVTRAPWPRERAVLIQLIATGVLMQAVMFGGAYLGLSFGVSAGLAALISGASPVVIAAAGSVLLRERLSALQWLDTLLGFAGIALAVAGQLHGSGIGVGVGFALLGTAGFAAGTLVQRGTGAAMDLRTGPTIQLAAAAIVIAPVAALHGGLSIPVTGTSVAALLWLALGNSGLAFALMFLMLRHRRAADTTRIMLLVPPLTAVLAWPLLHQSTDAFMWLGLAVTAAGIAIASREPRTAPSELDASAAPSDR